MGRRSRPGRSLALVALAAVIRAVLSGGPGRHRWQSQVRRAASDRRGRGDPTALGRSSAPWSAAHRIDSLLDHGADGPPSSLTIRQHVDMMRLGWQRDVAYVTDDDTDQHPRSPLSSPVVSAPTARTGEPRTRPPSPMNLDPAVAGHGRPVFGADFIPPARLEAAGARVDGPSGGRRGTSSAPPPGSGASDPPRSTAPHFASVSGRIR